MALQFEAMTPSGQFGDTCEVATMDLRPMMPDDVLRNIPRFFGRWEDGTTMPVLLDDNYNITTSANDCDPSTADREVLECTILLPDQELVSIGNASSTLVYTDVLQRFCDARSIFRFPTLFRADGSFDEGAPLAGPFIEFLLAELRGPLMKHLRTSAWNGDSANRHEFDGILTQLAAGPAVPSGGDECTLLNHVVVDWATVTGNPGSTSSPKATIAAASDSMTIHGVDFDGLTGLNMVEFLVLWLERLLNYDLAAWADEDMMFELWVGRGQVPCIAELAACMQPCDGCVDPLSDPMIRERAAEFRRDRVIWLYPYDNIRITIRQSPELANTMIFLPKMIGGRPTVAWIFRDQVQAQAILDGELPWFGTQAGAPSTNSLYPGDEALDGPTEFFLRAFSLHLTRDNNCINVYVNSEAAILLFATHVWLEFQNTDCAGLIPETDVNVMGRAATACATVDADTLRLTVANLEADGAVNAGDTFVVYPADGVTALLGTADSYNTGTDALDITFEHNVTCSTGGGMANALVVRHYDNA